MTQIISGRDISEEIRRELKDKVSALKDEHGITPGLATVLVGADSALTLALSGGADSALALALSWLGVAARDRRRRVMCLSEVASW